MTHRLYTNEYNTELVFQLSRNVISGYRRTDESTENVLVIEGELEDLQKLSSLMYVEDENAIKAVLPSFISAEEVEKDIENAFDAVYCELEKQIINVINKDWGKTSHSSVEYKQWRTLMDMYHTLDKQRA